MHGGRFTDNAGGFGRGRCQSLFLFFERFYLRAAETELQCGRYRSYHLVILPGLGYKIGGSLLDGLYGFFRIGVCGDKYYYGLGIEFQNLFQPSETFTSAYGIAAEVHIQQYYVVMGT